MYIPVAVNPIKTDSLTTPAEHRLAMLRLAVADVPGAQISTIELQRCGPSYTIDTLRALRDELGPQTRLYLLMGSDQALVFHDWKDWQQILDLATPAVMVRPPLDVDAFSGRLRETYEAGEADRWRGWLIAVPQLDICATDLRHRLATDGDARGLLQPTVWRYIREHGLYRA